MEEINKLKEEDKQKIKGIFEPNEKILIAFPFGKKVFDTGWRQSDEPIHNDNLIVTNKRVIIIPKEWFTGKKTYIFLPYFIISSVELKEQVMGTTLLIKTETQLGTLEYTLDNCPKKEGGQTLEFLQMMKGKLLCEFCLKPVKEEFVYCPFCKHTLKRLCSSCQKVLESEWLICPFCGK